MALEIIECVFAITKKIYQTVDEVQANKKRCQRLADRIRFLVAPLNALMAQGSKGTVYKEALIDLVSTLEESRQFLKTFTKEKSVLRKVQDACYANKVKETFENLNDRLNMLVPALTFGLQVECRKSVRNIFSASNRLPEDTKDESRDLKDIQKLLNTLGMPSFHCIKMRELKGMKLHNETEMYVIFTAKYRMNTVVVKRPNFAFTSERKEAFLNDARNLLQFNSEHIVRVLGICLNETDKYLLIQEFMELGDLHQVLQSQQNISDNVILRMCIETSLGLYFVHCSDVVHGNLSSSSYQVNSDFHVKISGFEFSVTESGLNETSHSSFCCKEAGQVEEKCSGKADVYRYGFVLCEIITRSMSLHHKDANDGHQLCPRKCASTLDELQSFNEIAATAKKCLHEESIIRPTMEEIVRQLSSIQEREKIQPKVSKTT